MTSPEDEPLFSSQTSGKPRPRLYTTTWHMYDKISLSSSYLLDWLATCVSNTERTVLFSLSLRVACGFLFCSHSHLPTSWSNEAPGRT
ncbi:uncharacterized protein BT62DRAFT_1002412 [Guyanagaster necrorhizus]|uniref:Uncharacterized protein n=1 Tax=Guyanagaster necrorhizus TaxID=856835 RepID=A0A9P7VYS7_9AGAR|nr:uncharacterized protein BT62DRAFT_1002412 [Guyanagaster necrorhizus MCA 3950]KAG7450076.1 hypothetical protein BT62DRAFT_1002412 [Guyanagaster necrorhizus MCA 3950]